MMNADEIRATGLFSEGEIQAGINDEGGYVGERTDEKAGPVKYYITLKKTARLPDQFGERRPRQ